jgi:hypothetical protein
MSLIVREFAASELKLVYLDINDVREQGYEKKTSRGTKEIFECKFYSFLFRLWLP